MRTIDTAFRCHARLKCVFGALLVMLVGCDEEPEQAFTVPQAYVGVWEQGRYGKDENYMYLQITADGQLAYARFDRDGGTSNCVSLAASQVDAITDSEINASVLWLFSTDFEIDEPPTASGETLRMTIDGRVLTRTDNRKAGFDFSWDCDDGLSRRRVR